MSKDTIPLRNDSENPEVIFARALRRRYLPRWVAAEMAASFRSKENTLRLPSVHEAIFQRVTNDLGVVGQFQLPQDVLAVGADRFDAEREMIADLFHRCASGNEEHDFELPR